MDALSTSSSTIFYRKKVLEEGAQGVHVNFLLFDWFISYGQGRAG